MRLFLHELRGAQRLYWRSRELAFFTVLLPIIFFVLLGSAYGNDRIDGVRGSNYLLAGMLGYGVIATTFAGLAIFLVIRRESGVLKRLRATPLPASTYLTALLCSTLIAYALEAVALLVLGRLIYHDAIPTRLFSLIATLAIGALSFTALGVGLTGLIKSAEGASAVVNAIYLPVSFISGAFFSPHSFPQFLRAIASVLPLTYFIRLVRDVDLHDKHIWEQPGSIAVILAWGLAGAILAARRFRWEPTEG